jgi:hypothetical protein
MAVHFDTPARHKLIALKNKLPAGASELARRLNAEAEDGSRSSAFRKIDHSQVSRWLSGKSRPDPIIRPAIERLAEQVGIDGSFDWMTLEESRELSERLSAMDAKHRGSAA